MLDRWGCEIVFVVERGRWPSAAEHDPGFSCVHGVHASDDGAFKAAARDAVELECWERRERENYGCEDYPVVEMRNPTTRDWVRVQATALEN